MGFGILIGLIVYFFLAKAVAKAVEKKTGSKKAKYVAIAIFVLIPTWDIIPGYVYFNYLCEKEAGVKVFKAVEVDKTYFMGNGQPDERKLADRFTQPFKLDRDFSSLFHIGKRESVIQDKQTGEIFGTASDLLYYGGWLQAGLSDNRASRTCPVYLGHTAHAVIWQKVFKLRQNAQDGGH